MFNSLPVFFRYGVLVEIDRKPQYGNKSRMCQINDIGGRKGYETKYQNIAIEKELKVFRLCSFHRFLGSLGLGKHIF